MSSEPSETDLHAYVDGALDAAHRREVEAHLAANTADAERVRAWQDQRAQMRALFNPVLEEVVPDRLRAAVVPKRGFPYALAASFLVASSSDATRRTWVWNVVPCTKFCSRHGAPAPQYATSSDSTAPVVDRNAW